jgi:hypothetical protein
VQAENARSASIDVAKPMNKTVRNYRSACHRDWGAIRTRNNEVVQGHLHEVGEDSRVIQPPPNWIRTGGIENNLQP